MKKYALIFLFSLLPITLFAQDAAQPQLQQISQHYAALPNLYTFDSIPKEQLSDTISRRYIMGSNSMIVKWDLKKGAIVPMHFHPNEQITWITKGSVKV